jgi:hypothetical protein
MKIHRAPLARGILILMASTFQQEAVGRQPVLEASQINQKTPQATQAEWKEFSSRQGGFSVLMPGTPKEETEVKELPVVGRGETHLFVLASESGVYVAAYLDVPGLARQTQAFCDSFGKGFLNSIGDATAKGAGGRVAHETDITMGNYPGKEILIEVPAGNATARAYFIKRRGYQLIAAPTSGSDPANVKKFLDSLKVTAQ